MDFAAIKAHMAKDRLAKLLGIEIIDARPGHAKVRMTVREDHLNGMAMTHGGTVFSLADLALATASNSYDRPAVALSVTIDYIKATGAGAVLTATAEEESLTRKTGVYRITVVDEKGRKVALAKGTVFRLDPEKN